ncbi:MAG TPA: GNAT family N-acetyltransferase [Dongiaceae bacterium]|nr:GNAT family N-acetyltransferase [Dongiaceae bacterium]
MGLLPLEKSSKLASTMSQATGMRVYRAADSQVEVAYAFVQEYYEAAAVMVREDLDEFAREYFVDGGGVWLAEDRGVAVGCIALRALRDKIGCGEIKRLYIRPEYRGQGLADRLLEALESYAKEIGYEWLYLDTAADMKAAARFYEKKGFEPCERYNENPQAAIFMRKAVQ